MLDTYEPDEIRRWIRALCFYANLTPTSLARLAGVAPSTVNKFLNDPTVKHQPSSTTLQKLESAAHRTIEGRPGQAERELAQVETAFGSSFQGISPPWVGRGKHLNRPFESEVIVKGFARADEWREGFEWGETSWFPIHIYNKALYVRGQDNLPLPRFGVQVADRSVELIYPEGSMLVCIPTAALKTIHVDALQDPGPWGDVARDLAKQPTPGRRVLVQRLHKDDEGELVEITVREYQVDENEQAWLWFRSTAPELQAPLRYTPGDSNISIVAVVVGGVRPD